MITVVCKEGCEVRRLVVGVEFVEGYRDHEFGGAQFSMSVAREPRFLPADYATGALLLLKEAICFQMRNTFIDDFRYADETPHQGKDRPTFISIHLC